MTDEDIEVKEGGITRNAEAAAVEEAVTVVRKMMMKNAEGARNLYLRTLRINAMMGRKKTMIVIIIVIDIL
jgi:hypothetical protein